MEAGVNAPPSGTEANSPAAVTDQTRASDPVTGLANLNDFERVIYVRPSQDVTSIGRNNNVQKRAFVSATTFYEPPLAVQDIAHYVGGDPNPAYDLVALRCRPSDPIWSCST